MKSSGPTTRLGHAVLESEMIVLGRCVQSAQALEQAKAALTPDDFFQANHATIFHALCAVDPASDVLPLTQVTDSLRKIGQLAEVGSQSWFADAIDKTPTDAVLPYHIQRILSASWARQAMKLALEVYESASEGKDWWVLAESLVTLRHHETLKPKRRFLGMSW